MGIEQEWNHVDEAIEWIHRLTMHGIKPGLKRMEWMLERLGHPERQLKFIHIGGTNGKGSTLAFMRHVLQSAGYQVGTYTSPYIVRFQNRIQVNGNDIADADLLHLTKQVKPLAEELSSTELGSPTEFEVVTVIALLYFARVAYPDYVLWEVGLGGRYDSTNVVYPLLSVITNIGYDHMHILGDTLEQITMEKAGIIKPGVPVVTGIQAPELLAIIEKEAGAARSSVYRFGSHFDFTEGAYQLEYQRFSYRSLFNSYEELEIRMMGQHQLYNAALAIMALEILKQYYAVQWERDNLAYGLKQTNWVGRMERIADSPLTLLDGAHNPEGMKALRQSIIRYFTGQRVTVIFSALKGKDIQHMLSLFDDVVDEVIVTTFNFPRAASIEQVEGSLEQDMKRRFSLRIEKAWRDAYRQSCQDSPPDVIIFTGSLYFISEVRATLLAQQCG